MTICRTTVTTAHGGSTSGEDVFDDADHTRHYQVYRGMSPNSSHRLEVCAESVLSTGWAKNRATQLSGGERLESCTTQKISWSLDAPFLRYEQRNIRTCSQYSTPYRFFPGKSRNLKRRWNSRVRAECAFDAMNELVMCLSHRVDNMTEYRLGLLRHTTSYYHVVYRKALSPRRDMLITANALPICCTVRRKTRDWKPRHQTAGLVDARRSMYGKPNGVLHI